MASVEIRGLGVQRWLVRDYPQDTLAGQVLGFVGADGEGLEGIERLYDDRLAGREGRISWLRDVRHRPIWADGANYRPPVDGKPVRLSIDAVIQAIAEQALAEACRKFDAPRGEVVVMRPTTGEILAMANYPFFAPDEYRRSKPEDWRNRAVTDTFEPGSTFKPFIWTIATTLGYAQLDEMIDCTEAGVYRFESGRRLHDSHGNGILSWEDVLVESSNIGMGIVGTRMGNERMYAAIRAFGFGELTHSHLPGEVAGILHPVRNWSKYSITSLPMGHEIGVTNLQIVRGYCTFANGGFLVRPTILAVDPSQPTVPVYQRVLDPQTVMTVQRALQRVVLEGTGTRARSEKYRIMGKTGTTQLVDAIHGGYVPGKYVSGFVGIAPATKPELSIGCFIHESDRRKGYYGGTVAAPVVKTIVEESLEYMGVPYDPPLMPESTPLAHVTGD